MSRGVWHSACLQLVVILLESRYVACQQPYTVLIDAEKPEGKTAITPLHTDLLAGEPGYFWGNLTASDVQQACQYLTAEGVHGLRADVVMGNTTYTEDLKVISFLRNVRGPFVRPSVGAQVACVCQTVWCNMYM